MIWACWTADSTINFICMLIRMFWIDMWCEKVCPKRINTTACEEQLQTMLVMTEEHQNKTVTFSPWITETSESSATSSLHLTAEKLVEANNVKLLTQCSFNQRSWFFMQVLHLQFVQPLLSLEAARSLHLLLLARLQDQSCHKGSQSQTWYSCQVPLSIWSLLVLPSLSIFLLIFLSLMCFFLSQSVFSVLIRMCLVPSLESVVQSASFRQPSAFCTPGQSRELFFHLLRYLAQRGVHSHLRERPQHALHRYADCMFRCLPSFSITSHFQSMCCLCLVIMALSLSVIFSLLCLCKLRGLTASALVWPWQVLFCLWR